MALLSIITYFIKFGVTKRNINLFFVIWHEVLTILKIKIVVFYIVTLYIFLGGYQRFE
jgi:hypothetical protein